MGRSHILRMVKRKSGGKVDRIRSGIRGLDNLLGGGFVKNSTVLVRGDTGTAKTLFCINYLCNGAQKYKEPGVFLTLSETEESIMRYGKMFNWDMDKLIKTNKLTIIRRDPHEIANMVKAGGGTISDSIESLGAKRLVIDCLSAYELVFENKYKATASLLELYELMRDKEVTSLVTLESPVTPISDSRGKLGYLTDTIINLYSLRDRTRKYRALEVIKMRHTNHDNKINKFSIDNNGIKITSKRKRW
jgi:KaiC/GvpD/RAD55 family RecA-like ATPase